MTAGVVLLDFGAGDLRGIQTALTRAGASVSVTADYDAALRADGLVVAAAGAVEAVMRSLRRVRGPAIIDRRLAGSRPVFGIDVGHHVLFESAVEGGREIAGCGEWPGTVEELAGDELPLAGWKEVDVPPGSQLFAGVEHETFSFANSSGVRRWELTTNGRTTPPLVAWVRREPAGFVAAVENGPLWATQFQPEKSGDAGAAVLFNWVKLL